MKAQEKIVIVSEKYETNVSTSDICTFIYVTLNTNRISVMFAVLVPFQLHILLT